MNLEFFAKKEEGPASSSFLRVYLIFSAFIFVFYSLSYLNTPPLPNAGNPASGWWGWWDQGQYYRAVIAWVKHDFTPSEHWYFPGYPLIGAFFYRLSAIHPFYLPDIILFLITFFAFMRVSLDFGVRPIISASLFLLSTVLSQTVFYTYVVPWSTTPVVCLYMCIFALASTSLKSTTASVDERFSLPFLMGVFVGAIVFFRLTDLPPACFSLCLVFF